MLYPNNFLHKLQNNDNQAPALVKGNTQIFASKIFESSKKLAQQLYEEGMRKNDRIVIAAEPGIEFLQIIYATMFLRVKVAIIDPEMGRENYREKLKQFAPQWAFVDARLLLLQEHPILRFLYHSFSKNPVSFPRKKGLKIISTGKWMPLFQKHLSLKKLLNKKSKNTPIEITAKTETSPTDHEYLVTYTSGTVTEPKGVLHSFHSLENSIDLLSNLLKGIDSQKVATHLPHFMLIGVSAGIPVYLWNYRAKTADKIRFLKENKITTLFGPPVDYLELMDFCERENQQLPACLQHVILGSAPIHVPFLERLVSFLPTHTRITCLYGMTENLLVSTTDGRQKIDYSNKGDLLGKPVENVEVKIAEDGEISLKSPQLYTRYWHQKNREIFHATGDLGYLDNNGNIVLTGRKKDMIIRRNFNLYPALYEPTIKKIKGIREAVLVGKYEEDLADEKVILAVEKTNGLTKKSLMKKLQTGAFSIDKEAWPDEIIFMKIPRKGRQSKIDRVAIRSLLL